MVLYLTNSNNYSFGNHFFKVLVQIPYSQYRQLSSCNIAHQVLYVSPIVLLVEEVLHIVNLCHIGLYLMVLDKGVLKTCNKQTFFGLVHIRYVYILLAWEQCSYNLCTNIDVSFALQVQFKIHTFHYFTKKQPFSTSFIISRKSNLSCPNSKTRRITPQMALDLNICWHLSNFNI
jgi:hypothetical protein